MCCCTCMIIHNPLVVKHFLVFWTLSDHLPVFLVTKKDRFLRFFSLLRCQIYPSRTILAMDPKATWHGWNMAKQWRFSVVNILCFYHDFYRCLVHNNFKHQTYIYIKHISTYLHVQLENDLLPGPKRNLLNFRGRLSLGRGRYRWLMKIPTRRW